MTNLSDLENLQFLQADMQYIISTVFSALKLPIDKAAVLSSGISPQGQDLVCAAICPLHGPIVRSSLTELVREYRAVSLCTYGMHVISCPAIAWI